MTQSQCRACAHSVLSLVLDFGLIPPSGRFLTAELASQPEPIQALRLMRCESCGLLQLDTSERPSPLLLTPQLEIDRGLSTHIAPRAEGHSSDLILMLTERARTRSVTIRDSSAQGTALVSTREILDQPLRSARCIVGLDALASSDEPHDLLRAVAHALAEDGVAFFDLPSLQTMHDALVFDLVRQETRCYYSIGQAAMLMRSHDLEVVDVEPLSEDSAEVRLVVRHRAGCPTIHESVSQAIEREQLAELDRPAPWADFAQLVELSRDMLVSELEEWLNRNKLVVAWTRGGFGMTLLAYCRIDSLRMPYLVEEVPAFHGLLTPGHRIPIVSPSRIERERPDVVLLLGQEWNSARDGVLTDCWRRGTRVLLPLPKAHYAEACLPPSDRLTGGAGRDTIVPGLSFSEFA